MLWGCRPDVISLAFEEHDADSDGLLTAAEAEQALKQAARVSMPRFRMKHAIADAEAGSPSISIAEFRTLVKRIERARRNGTVREADAEAERAEAEASAAVAEAERLRAELARLRGDNRELRALRDRLEARLDRRLGPHGRAAERRRADSEELVSKLDSTSGAMQRLSTSLSREIAGLGDAGPAEQLAASDLLNIALQTLAPRLEAGFAAQMVEALKGAGGGLALGSSGYQLCAERDGKPIEDAQQKLFDLSVTCDRCFRLQDYADLERDAAEWPAAYSALDLAALKKNTLVCADVCIEAKLALEEGVTLALRSKSWFKPSVELQQDEDGAEAGRPSVMVRAEKMRIWFCTDASILKAGFLQRPAVTSDIDIAVGWLPLPDSFESRLLPRILEQVLAQFSPRPYEFARVFHFLPGLEGAEGRPIECRI